MIPIDYSEISFSEDRIVFANDGRILVRLSEVWAIGYKKPSFLHWLSMKHDWMAMGGSLYRGKIFNESVGPHCHSNTL